MLRLAWSLDPRGFRRSRRGALLGAAFTGIVSAACGDEPSADGSSASGSGASSGGGSATGAGGTTASAGGTTSGSAVTATGAGGLTLPPGSGGGPDGPCVGLECQQVTCDSGVTTTVTGTVYDPGGTLPLYNVMVYVPNGELEPLTEGASCNSCDATITSNPVASAITDTAGRFVLENAPVGESIPLVIQVGKWRRQVTLPSVTACTENAVTDVSMTRLPANQSEGDMPRIALSTGELDALECLLRKIGISDSEFTNPDGSGRINLFAGHEGTPSYDAALNGGADFEVSEDALWDSTESLIRYDVVLLACEGGQFLNEKPESSQQAVFDYANAGGRIFFSHWHKVWLEEGPDPFPDTVEFTQFDTDHDLTATIDTTFPKGNALAEWLMNVQGSTTLGAVDLVDAQNTAAEENPDYAQRWIYNPMDEEVEGISVKYITANTPLGSAADAQCGRIVYSDIHVSTGDTSSPNTEFPAGCTSSGLTPQEKVLVFMLFDLSACLIPDDEPPRPPRIR
jgi:hypothetical protein